MQKPHKPVQTQGRKHPSAAQTQTGTGPTYGSILQTNVTATNAWTGLSDDAVVTPAPPISPTTSSNGEDQPLTWGHLRKGWSLVGLVVAIMVPILGGTWWISHLSAKVDQHEGNIIEVKSKTEKLEKESASTTTQIQTLTSSVSKLEDRMYNEATTRKQR